MRSVFQVTFVTSLVAALAVGGVLAWTGSAVGSSSATAGSISVAFYGYDLTSNKVVPNNGWIEVANGGLTNNGDIAVHVRADPNAGSVPAISAAGGCSDNILGAVNLWNGATVAPGGSVDDLYRVYLKMDPNAEEGCQNTVISYDVTINVES